MARLAGSHGETTAKAIRDRSLALFARHGYAAVSMRMIAGAVGVQPGALYQYHSNKQQLLVDLMRGHMEALLRAWNEEKLASDSPAQALKRFARFHIRYHITRPDDVFISYMELRALERDGFNTIEALRNSYEGALKAILEAGVASGAFKSDDPHVSTMAILAMLTGVNTWYRSGGRLSQQKIEDIYAAMVARSVGCELEGDSDV